MFAALGPGLSRKWTVLAVTFFWDHHARLHAGRQPGGPRPARAQHPAHRLRRHPANRGELFAVNTGGLVYTAAPLAQTPDNECCPDGARLAFQSSRDGNPEIYVVVSLDGVNPVSLIRLTHTEAADTNPLWSPHGSQIAFISTRDGNREVYVMNADGTSPLRLTTNKRDDDRPAWQPRPAGVVPGALDWSRPLSAPAP